jgi:hypothetical protein
MKRFWTVLPAVLAFLLLVMLLIPQSRQPKMPTKSTEAPDSRAPCAPSPEQLREHLRRQAEAHLDWADQECQRLIPACLEPLDRFFVQAKEQAAAFAEDALSWGSAWRWVADRLPFTAKDRQEQYLRAKFEEHVFTAIQLEAVIRQALAGYDQQVQAVENQMLARIVADLDDLPPLPAHVIDKPKLEAVFRQALHQAQQRAQAEVPGMMGKEVATFLAADLAASAAIRLGLAAGWIRGGALIGWRSVVIGFVAVVVVDQILSWLWQHWRDPEGSIVAALQTKLYELHQSIVQGTKEQEGLRQQLERLTRMRAQVRHQAVSAMVKAMGGER